MLLISDDCIKSELSWAGRAEFGAEEILVGSIPISKGFLTPICDIEFRVIMLPVFGASFKDSRKILDTPVAANQIRAT